MDEVDEEKIIKLIKSKDVLWNLSNINYKNNKFKAKEWEDISNEMNMPIDVIKKKWRNLRDTYSRNLAKKGIFGYPKTIEDGEIKWKHASQLDFLRGHLKHRLSHGGYDKPSKQEAQENLQYSVSSSETQFSCHSQSSSSSQTPQTDYTVTNFVNDIEEQVPKKMRSTDSEKNEKNNFLSTIKTVGDFVRKPREHTILVQQTQPQNADTEDELFCRSLVQKMSKFPVSIRNSTKVEVLRFLNEVEENWLDTTQESR